jgi:cellulose synthase/poly-beta-1,6-N-acetylglucosamine synthase-like glycosyltransferase
VVVFDGDHQPRPDVLRRLVRHFEDPAVAAVQGRCRIRNAGDSLLSRLVAIDYLAGYFVNEYGRQSLFQLPAYGGANCAVRTSRLRELGGWNADSVTEDTDLTIRLLLTGQKVRYDVTAVDEEEGVVTVGRFWRQRYRWARGHQQAWRDYRRAVWRSRFFSRVEKVEMTMFLLVFHLPVLSALALLLLLAWLAGLVTATDPLSAFTLWTLLLIGPLFELSAGLLVARADRREALMLAFFLPLFFISMTLCTKAWLDGTLGRRYTWVKTGRAANPPQGARA